MRVLRFQKNFRDLLIILKIQYTKEINLAEVMINTAKQNIKSQTSNFK